MIIERHESSDFDAKITITTSDALKLAKNRPLVFDDPSGTGQKAILLPKHPELKSPSPRSHSNVSREEHYYIKVGGIGPRHIRSLARGDVGVWTTHHRNVPDYEIHVNHAALEILQGWAEEQENA